MRCIAADHIKCQINGVEFNMGDGVNEGDASRR